MVEVDVSLAWETGVSVLVVGLWGGSAAVGDEVEVVVVLGVHSMAPQA